MADVQDVALGLIQLTGPFVQALGLPNPGQGYVGWPPDPDLTAIITKQGYAISVYPHGVGSFVPHAEPRVLADVPAPMPLALSLTGNTFTITGSPSGLNIPVHVGINAGAADALYVTQSSDGPVQVAIGLKNAVNALGIAGVTATQSNNTFTVSGANTLQWALTQSRTLTLEVGRWERELFQMTLWTPTVALRKQIQSQILSNVGVVDNYIIPLADGTVADGFLQRNPKWSDASIQKKSVFVSHIFFELDFSDVRIVSATEISVGQVVSQLTTANGVITTSQSYNTTEADA